MKLQAVRVADRRGFSFIELLVAIVIGSVVTTVLFQLIAGQGRFVQMQSAREEVQQNNRAAIELISSELRTLPGGEALVRASADSITLRTARVWGVVCAVTGATTMDVILPALPGASYAVNTGTGVVVNVAEQGDPDDWTDAVIVTGIGNGAGDCLGEALPAGAERRILTLASTPQSGATTPDPGDSMYLYDQVTYRSGISGGLPGRWIQRRAGDAGASTNQPMAGPIEEEGGLYFEYYAGSALVPTPILDPAARAGVTRVLVAIEAVSRTTFGSDQLSKADTVSVTLRNRL